MGLLVSEVLKIGETALVKAGCMDPKLDGEILFCHMMNLDKAHLFMKWASSLGDEQCEQYFRLIDIRVSGVPVQHITGWQEFMGIKFKVNEHVLIPRQDTETLVEEVLAQAKEISVSESGKGLSILDLCCGSGAIGISVASGLSGARVTASDLSKEAIAIAKENAKLAKIDKRISFVEGDLLLPFKKKFSTSKFNIIVSNPPYIKSEVIPTLQREVRDHEPMMALDGGNDGLDFYKKIIRNAHKHLKKKGRLFLEIGHDQADEVVQLIDSEDVYIDVEVIKDLPGHDRVVFCKVEG